MKTRNLLLLGLLLLTSCSVLRSGWDKFKATGDKVFGTVEHLGTNAVETAKEIVK